MSDPWDERDLSGYRFRPMVAVYCTHAFCAGDRIALVLPGEEFEVARRHDVARHWTEQDQTRWAAAAQARVAEAGAERLRAAADTER